MSTRKGSAGQAAGIGGTVTPTSADSQSPLRPEGVKTGDSSTDKALVTTAIVILLAGAYFLPTIVAAVRSVANLGSVLVINLFLGWTFIGWVIALAMASRSSPVAPTVQVMQHLTTSEAEQIPAISEQPGEDTVG